jgi:hypothetical protein
MTQKTTILAHRPASQGAILNRMRSSLLALLTDLFPSPHIDRL